MSNEELTVRQKFINVVKRCDSINNSPERQDTEAYQKRVFDTLKQINTLQFIIQNLSLFSTNETLREINTSYLPFATLPYYEAGLYQKLLTDASGSFQNEVSRRSVFKSVNLKRAKVKIMEYLIRIDSFKEILSPEQLKILSSFESSYNPTNEEIISSGGDPALRRAHKIANFKLEKELRGKLEDLNRFYDKDSLQISSQEDILEIMDEDNVRSLYIAQLKLFSIFAFHELELIAKELMVIEIEEQRHDFNTSQDPRHKASVPTDAFEYTSKLESDPMKHKSITELIDKQGRILQPFVITGDKQKLRKKVFGTGQVLPSMSIEEYLDYELENGKLLKDNAKDVPEDNSDETDDSDEELQKREWDDWKDENPKGSGNMKANIG